MARKIFINRRGDDPGSAGRLFDHLKDAFKPDELFMDVVSIPPGLDFVDVLDQQVVQCDVFLAVIGKDWLHSTDATGQRRLDDPADFVRIEIESALKRSKRVIPVLVTDAQMPRADELPESLTPLARRNAVRLSHESFGADSARLIRDLKSALAEEAEKREQAEAEAQRQAEEKRRREESERQQAEAESEARRQAVEQQRREAKEREQAEAKAEQERQAAQARRDDVPGTASRRRAVNRSIPENRWGGILGGVAVLVAVVAVVIVSTRNGTDISDLERAARTQAKAEPEPEPEPETETAPAQEEIESPLSTLEPSAGTAASQTGAPLETFRDCAECPEMVEIPAGRFVIGSPSDEAGRRDNEGPQRDVAIPAFAMGKHEVAFAEWDACVAGGGCSHEPEDRWGRDRQPMMRVSWEDAQEYVGWLSETTGESYRLPSEAEWEYAARAGTTTAFAFGDEITSEQANFGINEGKTREVGSYAGNAWGLHDMHGNVWEWVEDCWNESYEGAPTDGTPWLQGNCSVRVVRGGSWVDPPGYLRSAIRYGISPGLRNDYLGFRVARAFTP